MKRTKKKLTKAEEVQLDGAALAKFRQLWRSLALPRDPRTVRDRSEDQQCLGGRRVLRKPMP